MRSNVQMVIVLQPAIYVMVLKIVLVDGMKSPVLLLKVMGRQDLVHQICLEFN